MRSQLFRELDSGQYVLHHFARPETRIVRIHSTVCTDLGVMRRRVRDTFSRFFSYYLSSARHLCRTPVYTYQNHFEEFTTLIYQQHTEILSHIF